MKTIIQKLKLKFKKFETFENLEEHKWFMPQLNRHSAEEFLKDKQIGVFIIRESESIQQALVLSVKVPTYINSSQFCHYVIMQSKNGVWVRGIEKKIFKNLDQFITFCSNSRDIIPVKLDVDFYILENKTVYNRSNSLNSVSSNSSNFSDLSDL
ncbi:tensin-4-like isoform X1 [Brachionus plicatilis]|uniref:Tensin-4-like isoform X1 n=1 Tax=Brachionus plicatilis TaxID=10195 RepID=A0A3M7T6I7_BRAPC|nr:tensin-4-like isoform X1 [Brachionus plicatilis]